MKKNLLAIITIPFFLMFTVCIYAPFEIYLLNREEFWFNLSHFWWMPILLGTGCMVLAMAVIGLLKGKARQLFLAFLFGVGVCCYIQGNFLNLDLGLLNGADIDWGDHIGRIAGNAVIWLLILEGIIWLAMKKNEIFRKLSFYLSMLLTAMQAAALLVLLVPAAASGEEGGKEISYLSDEGLYEVGEDNVVVFVLDMFDSRYLKEVLEEEPDLPTELDGFTWFPNFSGGYSTTMYSLNFLFSGHYYHNEYEGRRGEWFDEVTAQDWYIDDLSKAGYDIYTYSVEGTPNKLMNMSRNYEKGKLKISNNLHFSYDLYQLVICKYFPDFMKAYFWLNGTEFNTWKSTDAEHGMYDTSNTYFKNGMSENGIALRKDSKQYKFIHLDGTHYPYTIDEEGNETEEYWDAPEAAAKGCINIVKQYMNELKEKGVYDETAIIVTADHGYYWDGALSSPALLVKPKGGKGSLKIKEAPVAQIDFAATVLDLAGLDNTKQDGFSVFDDIDEERVRLFYQYNLQEDTRRLIEYVVDNEGNEREHFVLTDVEYTPSGRKISHSQYCATCQNGILPSEGGGGDAKELLLKHEPAADYPEKY